jgi:hypothetical protein
LISVEGTAGVNGPCSYILPNNVENLTLTGRNMTSEWSGLVGNECLGYFSVNNFINAEESMRP